MSLIKNEAKNNILTSQLIKAAADGIQTIRILSDDTDVFVLLVYWTSMMQVGSKIQMEKWNGNVLDVNKTVEQLGPGKCSQLVSLSCPVRMRYYLIHLRKREAVIDQAPGDRSTRSGSSAWKAWCDKCSAERDGGQHCPTPLRTEELYNNE